LDRPCMGWNPEINLEAVTLKKPLIKKIPAKHLSVHLCVYIYVWLYPMGSFYILHYSTHLSRFVESSRNHVGW
jgi:hypothetical protein